MSTRNIADWNGPHRLVNSMTRFRLRSSGRATDRHNPQTDATLLPAATRSGGGRRDSGDPRSHTGGHLLSALLLFSSALFLSAVLFLSAARGSGAFRGPD